MAGFDDEIPAGAMDELISADTEDMFYDFLFLTEEEAKNIKIKRRFHYERI